MNGAEEAGTAVAGSTHIFLPEPPPSTPGLWPLINIDNGTAEKVRYVVRRRRLLPGYRARWERMP